MQLFQNVVEEHLLQHNLKSPPDLGRTRPVLKYVKWVISDCGVNVGRFFQISYGSLGNVNMNTFLLISNFFSRYD